MSTDLDELGRRARVAARGLAQAPAEQRRLALTSMAARMVEQRDAILAANQADMDVARAAGTSAALLDRMLLTPARIEAIAADTRAVAQLPDPLAEHFDAQVLPNGLRVHKRRTPLGVIGAIYEARPNVTVDIAALCLMAGSATILRGGSDIRQSVSAIGVVLSDALQAAGLPGDAVQVLTNPDRDLVRGLLRLDQYVDLIIPRGGAGLHRFCRENATIPVITGGIGVCHLYADATADLARAIPVIVNAKVQRPSVCNALETLLVDRAIARDFLPRVAEALLRDGVELRCDPESLAILAGAGAQVVPAGPDDFGSEFMALILSVKVVGGLDEAIAHIQAFSTGHSDGILTTNPEAARHFTAAVDSAVVYVNASTRFTDGGQLGLGAEVAISTQKLHARGPMGLRELTSFKWVVEGDWHTRP